MKGGGGGNEYKTWGNSASRLNHENSSRALTLHREVGGGSGEGGARPTNELPGGN